MYNIEYVKNGKSTLQIATEYNLSPDTLRNAFYRLGCEMRTNKKNYTGINENAFDTWTPEMAYWLGFIAADGSVPERHSHISIILKLTDNEHLIKLKNFLNLPERSLTQTINNYRGSKLVHTKVGFSSVYIKERLISLGILPNKSHYNIDFLAYVPYNFRIYFILGYFDGDGSYADKGKGDPVVCFVGSRDFLLELKLFMHYSYNFSDVAISTRSRDSLCALTWSRKEDVYKFAHFHSTLLMELPLKRKLETAKKIISGDIYSKCINCGVEITSYSKTRLCSKCQSLTTRKVIRPSREELALLLRENSFLALGRMFGVSDNAIRKWARGYDLI